MMQSNAKAMNILYCALDPNEYNRISTCELAKNIWDRLEVTHEGISQVKKSKINILVHNYELFKKNLMNRLPKYSQDSPILLTV